MSLHPKNTSVMWGTYNITKMFNLIETSELPSTKPFTIAREMLPNGESRSYASVNSDNTFSVTVSRDGAKANLDIISNEFDNESSFSLRIVDNTNGEVIAEYQNANLTTFNPAGAITDGAGNNFTIEWSCTNNL